MIFSNPSLEFKVFLAALARPRPVHPDPGVIAYGYARQALEDAFRILGLKKGDCILFPDYICDVTMAPCRAAGLRVRTYPLGPDFSPVWAEIEERIDNRVRAILTVNFFGFPIDVVRCAEITRRRGIWWIEDNAHGFGGSVNGRPLGTFGDVGVTSLRKPLPLLNGAWLHINNPAVLRWSVTDAAHTLRVVPGVEELYRLAGYALRWSGMPVNRVHRSRTNLIADPAENDRRPVAMDALSARLLDLLMADMDRFRKQRRAVYRAWQRFTPRHGLRPVFDAMPVGISPLCYPCLAEDIVQRDRWLRWGETNRVAVHTWPSLPAHLRAPDGPGIARWQRLLCFPVHHQIQAGEAVERLPGP
ncbi:MAG: DegT/DnrJ/EryC1/StrS family aminotransferase [Pseudomonadota bacterium]